MKKTCNLAELASWCSEFYICLQKCSWDFLFYPLKTFRPRSNRWNMVWRFLSGCFTCDPSRRFPVLQGRTCLRDASTATTCKRLSDIDRERRRVFVVELRRENGEQLGLTLTGGSDKDSSPKIVSLTPDTVAYRCDALAVGDFVISINGIRTSKLHYEEIVALLQNAGDRVVLEIEYTLPMIPESGNSMSIFSRIIQVNLEKEYGGFGLTLRNGISSEGASKRPLVITHLREGSMAEKNGTIRKGDRILAINNNNLSSASLQDALDILIHTGDSALFVVEYDISVLDNLHYATGSLLVELENVHGSKLGITLTHSYHPQQALVIESIKQASIAERCGALHVGDHILVIGSERVDHLSPLEAMQMLMNYSEGNLKLEISPVTHFLQKRIPFGATIRAGMNESPQLNPTCKSLRSHLAARSSNSSPHLYLPSSFNHNLQTIPEASRNGDIGKKISTSASCFSRFVPLTGINLGDAQCQVSHNDTTEITIQSDVCGFGFSLRRNSDSSGQSIPVISSIEPNGPAERTALLQVGDRILAVNGQCVQGMIGDELALLLQKSRPHVTLQIEFDVAESVVPSSGTFAVKLPKRGASLGITVTSPKNRQPGEPLLISCIQKGSVAHRTGTIQPGDKLLAIDSIRMDNCTIEDASQILLECGDIVKLRIRKDDIFSEEPDVTGSVVYTVELIRHGEPLGITLSGSEEPFDLIIISGLTEGGIAEKTGAIHAGDQLLAINGHSLRGKPLSEAILLLQNSRDIVTLKISKSREGNFEKVEKGNEQEHEYLCQLKHLPSVDSAVESWDSSKVEMSPCMVRYTKCKDNKYNEQDEIGYSCCSLPYQIIKEGKESDNLSIGTILEESNWDSGSSSSQVSELRPSYPHDSSNWCTAVRIKPKPMTGILKFSSDLQRSEEFETEETYLCAKDLNDFTDTVHHLNEQLSHLNANSLSDDNISEINSQIDKLCEVEIPEEYRCNTLPHMNRRCKEKQYAGPSDCFQHDSMHVMEQSFNLPIPIEVHQVCLFKDNVYEDFGFSISDGFYNIGVYINRIRPGGPAETSGVLRPFDRILQVNDTKTQDFNCCLTVPLIAAAGDKVQLLISRPAYYMPSTVKKRQSMGLNPWVDEKDHEECASPQPVDDIMKTITKSI